MNVGIEALNIYCGVAALDVNILAKARGLDNDRFENLMMKGKSVAMPYEDPVSFAVNAAKGIIDTLDENERNRIEMIITCTESGIDFGKSISTYVLDYLNLNRNCRLFEIKNACYASTAGLQTAINFILAGASPGAKVLVIGTDISRMLVAQGRNMMDSSFAEPSSGAGSVAMLVGDTPKVLQIDVGANGYYGFEVMDTCRPTPDHEAGDADLSLLSYLDCAEKAYQDYEKRVEGVDYRESFDFLLFHTPFGGMVKGAHRSMMRKFKKAKPVDIDSDFNRRVLPGFKYCQKVGNIMGGTVYLALAGLIDTADLDGPKRIGIFSYGSGCCSEFYSGVITPDSQLEQKERQLDKILSERYMLTMDEYESLFAENAKVSFGTRDIALERDILPAVYSCLEGKGRLILKQIKNYHREYEWV